VDSGKNQPGRLQGKPVVINFWRGAAVRKLPLFEKMWNKFKDVVFLSHVMDIERRLVIKNRALHMNLATSRARSLQIQVVALPATFFIDWKAR
jgi:hypothetical protein